MLLCGTNKVYFVTYMNMCLVFVVYFKNLPIINGPLLREKADQLATLVVPICTDEQHARAAVTVA